MFSSCNIHWNYGLLPQTWEDPSFAKSEVEGALGDNDPSIPLIMIIDSRLYHNAILGVQHNIPKPLGEVVKVKPLGASSMIGSIFLIVSV